MNICTLVQWLPQCLLLPFTEWFIHTLNCDLGKANLSHTLKDLHHWHEDGLHTGIWIAAFIEVDSKKNSLLKQIHCMQPLAQCSNSTLIKVALSLTDMFTYRHPNINAHMHSSAHGNSHKQVRCSTISSPLCAAQWLQTPTCEACVSLSSPWFLSPLSITHFSTCSHAWL